MAPEYRIYIPPEAQDKFEGFVSTIEGSQTWGIDPRGENYERDELIGRVRGFFAKFSKDAIYRESFESEAWNTFHDTLTGYEKSRISTTFYPMIKSRYGALTLEELSQMDWDQFPEEGIYIRNFGPSRKNFVRKTLEGLTFSDNQDSLTKNPS